MPKKWLSRMFQGKRKKEIILWTSLAVVFTVGFIALAVFGGSQQQKNDKATKQLEQSFVFDTIKSVKSVWNINTNDKYIEVDFTVKNNGNQTMNIGDNNFFLEQTQNISDNTTIPQGTDTNNPDYSSIVILPNSSKEIDIKFEGSISPYPKKLKYLDFLSDKYGQHDISINVPDYTQDTSGFTIDNFNKIDPTYTIDMVNQLFGADGTLSSESGQGTGYDLKTYSWDYPNSGVIITIMFQNGLETAKNEVGLN